MKVLDQLLAESPDDVARNLHVLSVRPAPDAGRLLVTVSAHPALGDVDVAPLRALAALGRIAPWLREEIAASIHRRRTPQLLFEFGHPEPETEPDPRPAPGIESQSESDLESESESESEPETESEADPEPGPSPSA